MGHLVTQFQGQILRAAANNRVCGHASTCGHDPTSPTIYRAIFSWPFHFGSGVFATITISWFERLDICEMFDHLHLFIIHYNSCIGLHFPMFRSLVCFTFSSSSLAFTMLVTFPINLSASSFYSSQITVSCACLRLEPNFHLSWFQFPHFSPVVPLTQCTNWRYVVKECNLALLLSQYYECTTVACIPSHVS